MAPCGAAPPSFLTTLRDLGYKLLCLVLISADAPVLFILLKCSSVHKDSIVFMKYSPLPILFIEQSSK